MNLKTLLTKNVTVAQTVLKNIFWGGVNNFGGRLIRTGLVIYAARLLGTAEYGVYSYGLGIAGIILGLSEFGLLTIMIREVAAHKERREQIISTIFAIRATLSIAAYFTLLIFVIFLNPFRDVSPLVFAVIGLAIFFDILREFFLNTLLALERAEFQALVNILNNVAILIIGLALLQIRGNALYLGASYAIANALGFAGALLLSGRLIGDVLKKFDRSIIKPILRDAWPMAFLSLSGTFLVYTDTLMLGWMRGAETVGLYAAASRPMQLLYLLPIILSFTLLPIFAREQSGNREYFKKMIEYSLRPLFIMALPITAGLFILAKPIIGLIYGDAFMPGFIVLKLLALTIVILFPATILFQVLLAQNRQKEMVKFLTLGSIINVGLNFFLIPKYGIAGAAFATLISQSIANFPIYPKVLGWTESLRMCIRLGKPLIATLAMIILILILENSAVPLMVIITSAALFYFAILWVARDPIFDQIKTILLQIKKVAQ